MPTQLQRFTLVSDDDRDDGQRIYMDLEDRTSPGVCLCPGCQDATLPVLRRIGYRVEEGGYLTIIFQPDNSGIYVLLNEHGRRQVDEWKEDDEYGWDKWNELWQPLFENGWDDVGEGTRSIVTPDGTCPDHSEFGSYVIAGGWCYDYNYYAIRLETEVIDEQGFIYLNGHQEDELTSRNIDWFRFDDFCRLFSSRRNDIQLDATHIDEDGASYSMYTVATGRTVNLAITAADLRAINAIAEAQPNPFAHPLDDIWALVYPFSSLVR
jgi:hypothetical protein